MNSTHFSFTSLPWFLASFTPNPWTKSLNSLACWVTSLSFSFCQINSCLIVKNFLLWLFKSFCSMFVLDDVGFLKVLLPTNLVPSTLAPYLGSILEISYNTSGLASINGRLPCWWQWESIIVPWMSDSTGDSMSINSFILVRMYYGTLMLIFINGELPCVG